MKLINTLSLLLLVSLSGFSQKVAPTVDNTRFFVKGGVGTSWIIMPKVAFVDTTNLNNAQILPATNSFTGYIGLQTAIPLGKHWLFLPEINFNYIAGEIRINRSFQDTTRNTFTQKLQSYARLEIPLNFGIMSSDNFWVSFGPVLFFTLSDNKGFDDAINEIKDSQDTFKVDSDNPFGLRFRLAAYIIIGKGMYIDVKFDSDLKRDFFYSESDDTYNMTMSMQSITVGFGYRLNRAD